uniref:TFIIS central domain-containing protein n=1 Tax=Oryzias sinensis TaxID=183150 RepID=A0A8C7YRD6_9TELE
TQSKAKAKKQSPPSKASQSPSPSSSRTSSASVSSTPPSQSSSSRSAHPPAPMSPMRPPPNTQMRQNIRRSLTDILFKRVSDSDDLKMTESEVGRLAFAIEKEMFNLCLSTDSKYKNKYRTLMLHLKDPKNKGLFYKVMGGDVTPFRLVRLSAEELVSREMSEWRRRDAPEVKVTSGCSHHSTVDIGPRTHSHGNRHEPGSHSTDMEDAPPTSDADEQDESALAPAQSSAVDSSSDSSNVADVFSSMLKDTTSEHRTHLFDLNCKICTGLKAEDEPAAKKAKLTKKPDTKPPRPDSLSSRPADASPVTQTQSSTAYQHQGSSAFPSHQPSLEPDVSEAQPSVYQEGPSIMAPPIQAPLTVAPAVSSVSISRRDPRVARHASVLNVPLTAPEKPNINAAEPLPAPVVTLMEPGVKSLLPMPPAPLPPPAPPALVTVPKPSKTSTTEPPPEGETAIFLHGQEKLWKGFINMQSVAKFVTKAYLVSGSCEHLKEDLPDTIHVGGRIPPGTVWDYVGKLKTSLSKELCLIRFHPATEEEEVAYVSLFSYFSSRKRFGVVANNRGRIKDLYLIPLGSNDPLPSKLLPFDGPGKQRGAQMHRCCDTNVICLKIFD